MTTGCDCLTARRPDVLPPVETVSVYSTQTFLARCSLLHSIVAMAKSKNKQPAKSESRQKVDKAFIKVDKKAFDPALSSLFASSVRA